MFTYPVTVQSLVRGACSEVRNQTSVNHLFKMMVKALGAFMTMASMRSQKNTAWAVTIATVMELSKLSDAELELLARLGLSVSYDTLLDFVKSNGDVFDQRVQEVCVELFRLLG